MSKNRLTQDFTAAMRKSFLLYILLPQLALEILAYGGTIWQLICSALNIPSMGAIPRFFFEHANTIYWPLASMLTLGGSLLMVRDSAIEFADADSCFKKYSAQEHLEFYSETKWLVYFPLVSLVVGAFVILLAFIGGLLEGEFFTKNSTIYLQGVICLGICLVMVAYLDEGKYLWDATNAERIFDRYRLEAWHCNLDNLMDAYDQNRLDNPAALLCLGKLLCSSDSGSENRILSKYYKRLRTEDLPSFKETLRKEYAKLVASSTPAA